MKWSEFINKARTDIHQHNSAVDPVAIWSAIESDVDKINAERRKKRMLFIWVSFGGLCAIGGILWLSIFSMKNSTQSNFQKQQQTNRWLSGAEDQQQMNRWLSPPSSEAGGAEDQPQLNADRPSGASVPPGADRPSGASVQQPSDSERKLNTRTVLSSGDVSEIKRDVNSSKIPSKSRTDQIKLSTSNATQAATTQKTQSQKSVRDNRLGTVQATKSNPSQAGHQHDKVINGNKTQANEAISSFNDTANEQGDQVTQHTNMQSLIEYNKKPKQVVSTFNPLNRINISRLEYELNLQPLLKVNDDFLPLKPRQQEPPFKLGISLTGGFGYSPKKLNAKTGIDPNLLTFREQSETTLETSLIGVSIIVAHKSGFELSLGLHQTTMVERFDYQAAQVSFDSMPGIEYYRIDLDGNKIPVMGTVVQTRTEHTNKEIYNRYRILELPVIIGYRHTAGKWSTGVHLGMLANISLKTSGQIMASSDRFTDIKTAQNEIFKSNLGFGYYAGLSIGYHLTPRLLLSMNPHVRGYSKSMTQTSYGLDEKHRTFGVGVGLTYFITSTALSDRRF